jgi:hypothetical protein
VGRLLGDLLGVRSFEGKKKQEMDSNEELGVEVAVLATVKGCRLDVVIRC